MFPDFTGLFRVLAIISYVAVPLALWKAIEIVIWIVRHVSIGVSP